MKYKEIIDTVTKYGEDYLESNMIEKLLKILENSESLQKQLEESVTDEWISRVEELKRVLVYEDTTSEREAKRIRGDIQKDQLFPFICCSYQDFVGIKDNEKGQINIPNLKYVIERMQNKDMKSTPIYRDSEIEK